MNIEETISKIEGETVICDNGNWSVNGQHYRDHYKVVNGKPTYVGRQHYWTNVAGKFDTENSGWQSDFIVNNGTLCVGHDRNSTRIAIDQD